MSNENNKQSYDFPIKKITVRKDKLVFDWFVISPFLEQAGASDDMDYLDAITKLNITKFTHNTNGYAIKNLNSGVESFFLNGLPAKKEDVERLKYNHDFADHVEKALNEE